MPIKPHQLCLSPCIVHFQLFFLSSKHHQLLFHTELKLAHLLLLKQYNQKAIHDRIQKVRTYSKYQHYFALMQGAD